MLQICKFRVILPRARCDEAAHTPGVQFVTLPPCYTRSLETKRSRDVVRRIKDLRERIR